MPTTSNTIRDIWIGRRQEEDERIDICMYIWHRAFKGIPVFSQTYLTQESTFTVSYDTFAVELVLN